MKRPFVWRVYGEKNKILVQSETWLDFISFKIKKIGIKRNSMSIKVIGSIKIEGNIFNEK